MTPQDDIPDRLLISLPAVKIPKSNDYYKGPDEKISGLMREGKPPVKPGAKYGFEMTSCLLREIAENVRLC